MGDASDDAPHFTVPASFRDMPRWWSGAAADAAWLAAIPALVSERLAKWALRLDGPPVHGANALAVPVLDASGTRLMLRMSVPTEVPALVASLLLWQHRAPVVEVVAVDEPVGAVLMERLERPSLLRLPVLDACGELGWLIRALAVDADADARHAHPTTQQAASDLGAAIGARRDEVDRAFGSVIGREVAAWCAPGGGLTLPREPLGVDGDLHGEQVLRHPGRGVWCVIDPVALVGDPAYAIGPCLWTRLDEFESDAALLAGFGALHRAAALDPVLARAWTLARAVQYWLWGTDAGLTDDPARCIRLARALA